MQPAIYSTKKDNLFVKYSVGISPLALELDLSNTEGFLAVETPFGLHQCKFDGESKGDLLEIAGPDLRGLLRHLHAIHFHRHHASPPGLSAFPLV